MKRSAMIHKLNSEIADLYRLLAAMPNYKNRKQLEDSGRMLTVINNHGLEIDRLQAELEADK